MTLSIASILAESSVRYADRTAVVLGPLRITYAELWDEAKRYAAVLRSKGIGEGDKVALLLPNTHHFPLAYFGVLALGGVAVPVHALLKAEEIEYVLTDSGAKVMVCAAPLLGEGAKGAELAGVPVLAVMDGGDASVERCARHSGGALHQRHDGQAQGRRDHPSQRHHERRGVGPAQFRDRRDRRRARLSAAVPHLRSDLLHEHLVLRRRHRRDAAALQRAGRAGPARGREVHDLHGRPHHVRRPDRGRQKQRQAAFRPTARCPAALPCPRPCSSSSTSCTTRTCSRATG